MLNKRRLKELTSDTAEWTSNDAVKWLENSFTTDELYAMQSFLKMVNVSAPQIKNKNSTYGNICLSDKYGLALRYPSYGAKTISRVQLKKNKTFQKIEKDIAERFIRDHSAREVSIKLVYVKEDTHHYWNHATPTTDNTPYVGMVIRGTRTLTPVEKENRRKTAIYYRDYMMQWQASYQEKIDQLNKVI